MSARIPPGNFETVMHVSGPGQSGDVQTALGWDGGDPLDSAWRTSWLVEIPATFMEQCSSSVSITSVDFVIGGDSEDDLVIQEGITAVGQQGPDMMPLNNSALISKVTGVGGRRNRGRMYVPGVPEASYENNGQLDVTAQVGWQSNLDAVFDLAAALAPPATPVLFHETAPFTVTPITALLIVPLIASQRRRIRG